MRLVGKTKRGVEFSYDIAPSYDRESGSFVVLQGETRLLDESDLEVMLNGLRIQKYSTHTPRPEDKYP